MWKPLIDGLGMCIAASLAGLGDPYAPGREPTLYARRVTDTERDKTERDQAAAQSFGGVADVYERARPSYPAEAVDWLVPAAARRVADVGAGTGKFTRGLTGRGFEVIAIEPSAGMRAELARVLPDVTLLAGSAEDIPVESGTLDAVLLAQAWHWVDRTRAVPEVARVLAPGGRLGLVWNIRDERVDWVLRLSEILAGLGGTGNDSE